MKVFIVIPALNAQKTLAKTLAKIPKHYRNIILVNDGSRDKTAQIGKKLGISVISHPYNRGYGASQKTGFREALKKRADIIVLIHADGQYDPKLLPKILRPFIEERADVVSGSRILGKGALKGGMPLWKYLSNRILTFVENTFFKMRISEFHSGYRAYRSVFLNSVPFELNSDLFDFDTEILVQAKVNGFAIVEIPISTIYEKDSSQMSFVNGIRYGIGILYTLLRYNLAKKRLLSDRRFRFKS